MKTLTFLLAVFVLCTLYLQSVELRKSRTSESSENSRSWRTSKRSGTSKSKQKEKRCIDSCQCTNRTVCLPKEFGKRRKTCQTCECRLSEQCRKNQLNEVFCDCSDSGYTGMNCETPVDKDECSTGTDCCNGESHNCTNTVGSYTCGCTSDAYQLGTDGCTCEDKNECAAGTDCCNGESHNCTNTVGSYTCGCTSDAYQLGTDGCTCEDKDECAAGTDGCNGESHNCTNTVGGYMCGCTLDVYQLSSDGCTCEEGQRCPSGWNRFKDKCYRYYETNVDWSTANENCLSIYTNSHLLEFNSIEEKVFIETFVDFELGTWLGLTDQVKEGEYVWEFSRDVLDIENSPFDIYFEAETDATDCVALIDYYLYDYECTGVTVLLVDPDPDTIDAEAVNAEHFAADVYPLTALQSIDPTSCGESWTVSTDPTIRRYDFCVGSSLDIIDDVVPCVWVGYNTSGVVEIKQGYIYIDDTPFHKISELRTLSKGIYSYDTINEDDNKLNMESGRTLFLFMRLCNQAELCSEKFVNSLLITNENTVLIKGEEGKSKSFELQHSQGDRKKRSLTSLSIEMPNVTVDGQSIVYNELTEENMTARYDSVASTLFKPYIVYPETTFNKTERLLYQRIKSFDFAFTLSPVGQTSLSGPLKLHYPNSNGTDADNETITMVIHWNPDQDQWQITNRTCDLENFTINIETTDDSSYILICDTRLSANQTKANQTYFNKETQFAITTVATKIENNAPDFVETLIRIDEDSENTQFQLLATDAEDDPFIYKLQQQETELSFGNITLTNEGVLTISLCANCYGNTSIKFILEDIPELEEISPAQADYALEIEVVSVNDPPNIIAHSQHGTNILPYDPTEPILIFHEQVGEPFAETVAVVITYDIDGPQNLQIISIAAMHLCLSPSALTNPAAVEWKGVYVNYMQENTSFVGIDTIKVVAIDEHDTFSDVLSVTVVVMENKCPHGKCKSLNQRQYSCNDTRRAIDFDPYYTCDCPTSWEGPYCEHDVDECARGFCEAWKVCDNKIGSYDCYCKTTDIICKLSLEVWEFSVIVTAIGVVILVLVGIPIVQKFKSKKYKLTPIKAFDKKFGPSRQRFAKVSPMPVPISTFRRTRMAYRKRYELFKKSTKDNYN